MSKASRKNVNEPIFLAPIYRIKKVIIVLWNKQLYYNWLGNTNGKCGTLKLKLI